MDIYICVAATYEPDVDTSGDGIRLSLDFTTGLGLFDSHAEAEAAVRKQAENELVEAGRSGRKIMASVRQIDRREIEDLLERHEAEEPESGFIN